MGVPPELDVYLRIGRGRRASSTSMEPRSPSGNSATRDIDTMARLVDAKSSDRAVNLGGIHHRAGRSGAPALPVLTADELRALRALAAPRRRVTAQDVPGVAPVPLDELLAERRGGAVTLASISVRPAGRASSGSTS